MRSISLFSLWLVVFFIGGCNTSKKLSNTNLAPLYQKDNLSIDTKYSIHHINDSITKLKLSVNTKNLLYTKQDNSPNYSAILLVKVHLYDSFDTEVIKDSSSFKFLIEDTELGWKSFFINLPVELGTINWMKTMVKDQVRGFEVYNLIEVNKLNKQTSGYFSSNAFNTHYNAFWFNSDTVNLKHSVIRNEFVNYFELSPNYSIPSPPYQVNYEENDIFNLINQKKVYLNDSGFTEVQLNSTLGFLQLDTNQKEGLLLFKQNKEFPQIHDINLMIQPMKYLMELEEFNQMIESDNKRKYFEKFWIDNTGSKSRARRAIKAYYDRVIEANERFTTYKPGWMTDMGLIYIIKGNPQSVKRTKNKETWYYGDSNLSDSEIYMFYKTSHYIFSNHYQLQRIPDYRYNWNKYIDLWKEGRL